MSDPSSEELRGKKLELLVVISTELSKPQKLDRLLDTVVDFTFQGVNADRVSMLLLEPQTGELMPLISKGRTPSSASKPVPQWVARKVVDERLPILSDNTPTHERFKGKSIPLLPSAMCTPLMGTDQQVLGILYVDNPTATDSFSTDDLRFLIALGSLAGVAIENSRRSERLRRAL